MRFCYLQGMRSTSPSPQLDGEDLCLQVRPLLVCKNTQCPRYFGSWLRPHGGVRTPHAYMGAANLLAASRTFLAMSKRLSRSGPPMLNTLCCSDARLLITARTVVMMSCRPCPRFGRAAEQL